VIKRMNIKELCIKYPFLKYKAYSKLLKDIKELEVKHK
jgi:hypothetical protein